MKMVIILTVAFMFHALADTHAQKITLEAKNKSLGDVMSEIQQQNGYLYFFRGEHIDATPITAEIKNADLNEAMNTLLAPHDLDWTLKEGIIVIRYAPRSNRQSAREAEVVQQRILSGKVAEESGAALEGVTVAVKGSNIMTITDSAGNYQLTMPDMGDVLVFTTVGYEAVERVIANETVINVIMKMAVGNLDEVVVVGYGTVKRKDLTGAVTSINGRDFETRAATSVSEFLAGTTAGVQATQGANSEGGVTMEIRGTNSLLASTTPLIVLDGAIYNGSLIDINPSDVASMDILQDASAAAVYGSRAANGVIIITTKRGSSDTPVVNFSALTGLANTSNDYRPFDGQGYLTFRKDLLSLIAPRSEAGFYSHPSELPAGIDIDTWRQYNNNPNEDNTQEWLNRLRLNETEINNYLNGNTVDWYDMRMQTGLRQDYNVSLSGNSNHMNYYLSSGYMDNEGIVFGDRTKTWRTRTNLEASIKGFFKVGINAQFANIDESSVQAGSVTQVSPYGTFANDDGTLKTFPHDDALFSNPFLDAYYKDQFVKHNRLFATFYTELKLPFGFHYRLSFQNRLISSRNYNFWPPNTVTGGINRQNGYGTRTDGHSYEWMVDNILSWNRAFGDHAFDFTFLANAEKFTSRASIQENENFGVSDLLGWRALHYGTNPLINNNDERWTADALMFRLNYNFKDRYMSTISWRRDGFSAFGQNHPRGFFPAVALSWRLSNEPFFNVNAVNDLKLRVSWGINGNRSVGAYAALANLSLNPYFDGDQVVVGVTNSTMANPDLKWEGTEAYNIGVDLIAMNGWLSATVDAYRGSTIDLLLNRQLPEIMGFESVATNLGRLSNRGINASVTIKPINKGNFSWQSNVVFTLNRNRIEQLWGDFTEQVIDGKTVRSEIPDYANEWFPGQAIDRVWNYRITGIWQEEEAEEANGYGLRPGEFKAEDVNGDGNYRQFDDKQFLGWEQPRYLLGFRNDFTFMKSFEASVFLRADLGHVGARGAFNHGSSNVYDRANTLALPYWTPENRSNSYPRLNVNAQLYEGGIVLYESRSFLRLQDISLTYQVDQRVLDQISVNQMRVFVSARNLITFSSWTGWDPESADLPMPRIFTLGLNASF